MTREEANKVLKNLYDEMTSGFDALTDEEKEAFSMAFKALSENKGEWIKDIYGRTICSYCGEPRRDNRIGHINFCNCCGCDMGGKRK